MKRITIKEIAKQAGVSIGTVDRVLHNRGEVAKKTAALVNKIASEGNYKANIIARGLRMKNGNRIGILLPNDNEYWKTMNEGILNEVNEVAGIGMTINSFVFDRHKSNSFKEQAEEMMASKPDGVIMAPIMEEETNSICSGLEKAGVPYLFVDSNLESTNPIVFIGQNSNQAGYLAAKLLTIGCPEGCETYIVRFNDFDSLNKTIDERITGFKNYFSDKGFDECLIQEIGLNNSWDVLIKEASLLEAKGNSMNIFVPNSRAYEVSEALQNTTVAKRIVGFDLVDGNRKCLKQNSIDFIIDQNPARQGSEAIRSYYKLNVAKEPINDLSMPLTIYTGENIE